MNIRSATNEWVKEFNFIPGELFNILIKADESVGYYDSPYFRLVASPRIECSQCSANYEGNKLLTQLQNSKRKTKCTNCGCNDWIMSYPEYGFPCGWGTLFNPKESLDQDWIGENLDEITKIGFFIFESDIFGYLLGIDAGGFDFYEAYWIPLYKLRGLQWHDKKK
jgi:hypothetical protein